MFPFSITVSSHPAARRFFMGYQTSFFNSISQIQSSDWQILAQNANPFLAYEFLKGLEEHYCVGQDTGWQPYFAVMHDEATLIAVMPGYLKTDSLGEYVFDQGWAQAYQQHGLNYYPKWVSAIPFTPVSGQRVLVHPDYPADTVSSQLYREAAALLGTQVSSLHILFAFAGPLDASLSWHPRYSVQFQWYNYDYAQFDDFLQALTSRKRRAFKKSRQQLTRQQITIERKVAATITEQDIDFFILCYQRTYLKRSGHTGYLSEPFLRHIFAAMSDNVLLVMAKQNDERCASALFFYDKTGLYGRYWGATHDIDGLHFECCYFQGIEFAIEHQLPLFNPGTQGEHKILRGFEPVICRSFHYLYEPAFHDAVGDFVQREAAAIEGYYQQARNILPFNDAFTSRLLTTTTKTVIP